MSDWSTVGNIVVAIIGAAALLLGSSLIPVLFRPNVDIIIYPADNNSSRIVVENFGSQPATNFHLFIFSASKITHIEDRYSTSKLDIANLNTTTLEKGRVFPTNSSSVEIHTDKVTQGEGSRMDLFVGFQDGKTSTLNGLSAEATYDQGSTEGWYYGKNTLRSLLNFLNSDPSVFIVYTVITASYPFIIYLQYFYLRRRRVVLKLKRDLVRIHSLLADNPTYDQPLANSLYIRKDSSFYMGFIQNLSDLMQIEDFYRKVKQRNKDLANMDKISLEFANREILEAAAKLMIVDWERYYRLKKSV